MKESLIGFVLILLMFSSSAEAEIRSEAFCLPAIHLALDLANPQGHEWTTRNEAQADFWERYGVGRADVSSLQNLLQSKVTNDSAELIDWFERQGFPGINISIPSGGVGVGTVFDLSVDWKKPGTRKSLLVKSNDDTFVYNGVVMSRVESWSLEGHPFSMFEIETRQGWKVFLVEVDQDYPAVELPHLANDLLNRRSGKADYSRVHFPEVRLDVAVDVGWLSGMSVPDISIAEVVKQVRLSIDDKGGRAESAFAITRRGEPSAYHVENPFLVIFWQEGLELPPFVALAAEDSWVPVED